MENENNKATLSALSSIECAFCQPLNNLRSEGLIVETFACIANAYIARVPDVICVTPCFYGLQKLSDNEWVPLNEFIQPKVHSKLLSNLVLEHSRLTSLFSEKSFTNLILSNLNGTTHSYDIVIKSGIGNRITMCGGNLLVFTVDRAKRLYVHRLSEDFVENYASHDVFSKDDFDNSVSEDARMLCEKIIRQISLHTLFLIDETDVLYYIFSAPVAKYDKNFNIVGRYGLGGLFVLMRNNLHNFMENQPNQWVSEFIEVSKRLIDKVSNCLISFYRFRLIRTESLKSAVAAIMSRNMSHNLGSHVVTSAKHQIEELEKRQNDDTVKVQLKGLSALMQYLQERQDFIAVIANDEHYPKGPLNFKSGVFDILAMDGPPHRHGAAPVNNYILDNIVRSENIARLGSVAGGSGDDTVKIELQLVKFDGAGRPCVFKSLGEPEIGSAFSDFTLSVNNGLNGRQALLTILENIIRNSAKHDKESFKNLEDNTLLFSVIFKEKRDPDSGRAFFEITIADNKRNFSSLRKSFEESGFVRDGRLAPLRILREDGGGIARENKGLKEMLISLAWLKYGEGRKAGASEITYDTLQNEPWELLEVVGVDRGFAVVPFSETATRVDLSLGFRFRIDKYKRVHLLSVSEVASDKRSVADALAALPGASLYAIRQSDYDAARDTAGAVLLAIPRLEVVPDAETEATLAGKLDDLFERNIRRRFRYDRPGAELPRLRISENTRHEYADWDRQTVVRDGLGVAFDRLWERGYPGPFIHYRNHYETAIDNAQNDAGLDLKRDALFTEGISGGNYTSTLIRTDVSRFAFLSIVESALVHIAIVDERIFAKCAGRLPRQSKTDKPDNPLWRYWEQKGVHILSSDDRGIFDLWGNYVSTGVTSHTEYDFLSIHLGLIDKTTGAENSTEKAKLEQALSQFGARYRPGRTKLAIHSGRGGMTQMGDDIAFIPLSGIEWAMDNCKYQLSEFFHGLKYPPFGDVKMEREGKDAWPKENVAAAVSEKHVRSEELESRLPVLQSDSPSVLDVPRSFAYVPTTRRVFLITTYAFDKMDLSGKATGVIDDPGVESFVPWETIREKDPDDVENYKRITHIDSTIFFYPCTKPRQRVLISPDLHGAFVSHLVGKILDSVPAEKDGPVDLHLVLHASDTAQRRSANTKDTNNPLIDQIKRDYPGKISGVTIWWFSHDGTGIHGHVLCDGSLFDGVDDKTFCLLAALAKSTNTPPPERGRGYRGSNSQEGVPTSSMDSARSQAASPAHVELRIPDDFCLNNKTYLDRLAVWQLGGANDRVGLAGIFVPSCADSGFWSPEFSPDRCSERLTNPHPLLVIGSKPLREFGREERRARYLDSSIWCRYAANEQEAVEIRKQFARNRELGLYRCNNGKEYLEFWARMLVNSRIGEFESSGHCKIVPTVFHSEGEMASKTGELVKQAKATFAGRAAANRPLLWKFLLVDDHARENLSVGNCSKLAVICEALSRLFPVEIYHNGAYTPYPMAEQIRPKLGGLCRVRIHYAETKAGALEEIKRQRFDIILLDYLLNKAGTTGFDTSDELLEEIKSVTHEEQRGPMGCLWFSNVSAFANAIDGRLTAKGMPYTTKEWRVDKGACPINTPELFVHNLLSFMLRQVDWLTRLPGGAEHGEREPKEIRTLIDLLRVVFIPKDGSARDAAKLYFHAFLKIRADYEVLRKDLEYGLDSEADKRRPKKLEENPFKSEIVFSLFPDIAHYTPAFWDHMLHLIFHTAHGSPQQWPQLLVNFKETKEILRRAGDDSAADTEAVVKAIEGYIIGLHDIGHRPQR